MQSDHARGGYTLSNLLSAIRDPGLFVRETERVLLKRKFGREFGQGIDVMDADWDNLLILDACRFDYFAEQNHIDGELDRAVSRGSNSREFIEANFADGRFHDTVLVTANPFVERLDDDTFFRICYSEVLEEWDGSLNTVPPSAVVETAIEMHERYPDKRLIAHFMQPHAPYIGPTGRELVERCEFGVFNPEMERDGIPSDGIVDVIEDGSVSEEELRRAYVENVEIAIEHAESLVEALDGRSVITADHGEALGERGLFRRHYGHGPRLYTPELRVVPWHVVPADERRTVTAGEPESFERLDGETRDSRLQALGYK